VTFLAATWLAGCECASADVVDPGSDDATSSSDDTAPASSSSSSDATGEPFDASRWIGRYHFENVFLPFGERGDPHGTYSLVNFEILPDGQASMFYDDCHYLEAPIVIAYEWRPADEGWLSLHPGEGETSLRYLALEDLESLRVHLVEPCRELRFEIDGSPDPALHVVRPGESCWVDRCTVPSIMQVDYCEGEEPPPCP
jgi:hypothetical protein